MTKKLNLPRDILKSNMQSVDLMSQHQKRINELTKFHNPMDDAIKQINALKLTNQLTPHIPQARISEMLKNAEVAAEFSKQLASIPNLNNVFDQMSSFSRHAADVSKALEHVRLPAQEAFALAELMSSRVKAFDTIAASQINWTTSLAAQIKNINRPWLHPEFSNLSVEGFAVISRLNTVVRSKNPFNDHAREIINEDLGSPIVIDEDADVDERDEAHIEAGMNPSIAAINPPAFNDVLIETGFYFKAEFMPLPSTEGDSDPSGIFHPGNYAIIVSIEQNLRQFISTNMTEKYGSNWVQNRIASKLIAQWSDRKTAAIEAGQVPYDLIQYSNFNELKDIIVGRRNWQEVFSPIFKDKHHFATSMERLHPIRLALAHSRPIGKLEQVILMSEASIILRTLGIEIHQN